VLSAPLQRLPVLARAGSLLPMQPEEGNLLQLSAFRPEGEQAGGGELYSDAGDGYGPHRVDRFALRRRPAGWELSWSSEGGHPFPYAGVLLELRGFRSPRVQEARAVPGGAERFLLPGPGSLRITESA